MKYVANHVLARRQKQWEKHLKEVALKKARAQHTRFPTLDKYGDLSLTKCAWCGRDDFRGGLATHYQEMECFEIVRCIRASRSILVSKPGMTLEVTSSKEKQTKNRNETGSDLSLARHVFFLPGIFQNPR